MFLWEFLSLLKKYFTKRNQHKGSIALWNPKSSTFSWRCCLACSALHFLSCPFSRSLLQKKKHQLWSQSSLAFRPMTRMHREEGGRRWVGGGCSSASPGPQAHLHLILSFQASWGPCHELSWPGSWIHHRSSHECSTWSLSSYHQSQTSGFYNVVWHWDWEKGRFTGYKSALQIPMNLMAQQHPQYSVCK